MAYAQLQMGINKYPYPNRLSGCVNDLANWSNVCKGYDYKPNSNNRLPDSYGTAKNFRNGLKALLQRREPFVVVQYSGHGTTAFDVSGDEMGGVDQAIVPVDFNKAGLVLDDELGAFGEAIAKAGKRGLIILDSCYSGNSSFGFMATAKRIVGVKQNTPRSLPFGQMTEEIAEVTSKAVAGLSKKPKPYRIPADVPNVWLLQSELIFIEMARDNETAADAYIASERKYNGAGTYALCYAWRKLGKFATYLSVAAEANSWLVTNGYDQRIQLEGRAEYLGLPFLT